MAQRRSEFFERTTNDNISGSQPNLPLFDSVAGAGFAFLMGEVRSSYSKIPSDCSSLVPPNNEDSVAVVISRLVDTKRDTVLERARNMVFPNRKYLIGEDVVIMLLKDHWYYNQVRIGTRNSIIL